MSSRYFGGTRCVSAIRANCTGAPAEITFGEIVRAMEGPIALVSCASVNYYAPCGDCHDEATCAIRRAFSILRDQSSQLLEGISLSEAATWEKGENSPLSESA